MFAPLVWVWGVNIIAPQKYLVLAPDNVYYSTFMSHRAIEGRGIFWGRSGLARRIIGIN